MPKTLLYLEFPSKQQESYIRQARPDGSYHHWSELWHVLGGGVEPDMLRVGHDYGSVEIIDEQTEDRIHQRSTRSHKPISAYQADLKSDQVVASNLRASLS